MKKLQTDISITSLIYFREQALKLNEVPNATHNPFTYRNRNQLY